MRLKIIIFIMALLNMNLILGQGGGNTTIIAPDLTWHLDGYDTSFLSGNNFMTPESNSYFNLSANSNLGFKIDQEHVEFIENTNPSTNSVISKVSKLKGTSPINFVWRTESNTDWNPKISKEDTFFGLARQLIITQTGDAKNNVDGVTMSIDVYLESEDSSKEQVLLGATNDNQTPTAENTKFGLSLRGKTLYFKMYDTDLNAKDDEGNYIEGTPGDGTPALPWKYEIWSPGSLDAGPGWYRIFLILAHSQKYMQIVILKPKTVEYGTPGLATFKSNYAERLVWMPGVRPGMSEFTRWYLGLNSDLAYSNLNLWNRALSTKQVRSILGEDKIIENEDNEANENTPQVRNLTICRATVGVPPSAIPFSNYTLVWYASATAKTPLASPPIITSTTKTYYVAQRRSDNSIGPRVAVTTTVNPLATAPLTLALSQGATIIKKVGSLIGTSTELTLTATGDVSTSSYNWILPAGVTQLSGGTSSTITVNLANVAPGDTKLDFSAFSVSTYGCISRTAKKLSVSRAKPARPLSLFITDELLPEIPTITTLSAYTGVLKTRMLNLNATPITTQGLEASHYKWVLPPQATTTATPVDGEANTYISTLPTIKINLANVTNEKLFLFKVFSVNGNGTSLLSRDLTRTSTVPKAPTTIFKGSTGSGTPFTTYAICGDQEVLSVPKVLGVTYSFTSNSPGVSIIALEEDNTVMVDFANAPSAPRSSVIITVRATKGVDFAEKSFTIRLGSCPLQKIEDNEIVAGDFIVTAHPNPTSDEFTIKISGKGAVAIQVYDAAGRLIESIQTASNTVQLGKKYTSGIYYLNVSQDDKTQKIKLIKR